MVIINIHRSPAMCDTHFLTVALDTPSAALDEFWAKLVKALEAKPNDFDVPQCCLVGYPLACFIEIPHPPIWSAPCGDGE